MHCIWSTACMRASWLSHLGATVVTCPLLVIVIQSPSQDAFHLLHCIIPIVLFPCIVWGNTLRPCSYLSPNQNPVPSHVPQQIFPDCYEILQGWGTSSLTSPVFLLYDS